jgi:hypothetical protein
MATFPKDRFDSVPDDLLRTGAHRGPAPKGRGWIGFAWAALATGILVLGGLFVLSVINGKSAIDLPFLAASESPTPTPTPTGTPTAAPKLDPAVPITVLNGTTTAGLANRVGDSLVKEGWAGAAADVGSRANTAKPDVVKTTVYYTDPANEGAARALVASLKVGTIVLSKVYTESPITVVLGSDYKTPTA